MSYHHAGNNGWEGERPSRTFGEYGQTLEADDDDGQMIRRPSHMRSSDYDDEEDDAAYGHSVVRSNKDSIPGLARPHSGEDAAPSSSSNILSPRSASHIRQYSQPSSQRAPGVSSSALGSRRSPSENGSSRDNWQSTTSRQPETSATGYSSKPESVPSNSNKLLGILNNGKPICSDYLAGRCRFGVLCHLRHALPTEDNAQTAQPLRGGSSTHQREPSTSSWQQKQDVRPNSPPTMSGYHQQYKSPDPERYRQNMEPPRPQYGQSNLQDDGWPVYKQLPPSLSAPVEPIAPEKPASTSYQVARSTGWISQDAAAQPSSRSEIASPKVDRLEREPVASSSKSAMEPGPRTQDNGWNRQQRPPSRSSPLAPIYNSPPPVPRISQQYSSQPTYDSYQDNHRDSRDAPSSVGTQDDGWPAYKPLLPGWEEPIIPYSPSNDRRDSPAPIVRKKAVWTSLDPEYAGQTTSSYAVPRPPSPLAETRHVEHRMPSRGTGPQETQRPKSHSIRTSTPPVQRSSHDVSSPRSPRRSISPPQQAPMREGYTSQQWQAEGARERSDSYRSERHREPQSNAWQTAEVTTNGRKSAFGEDHSRIVGHHREKSRELVPVNSWTTQPNMARQDRSSGPSAPLMTLGEYLADEGSSEQVARLTGQTLAQVEDGQRDSDNQKSMVTLPSGWSVPADAFHDDSIRPSESASNIGGTTNSSSSAAEGRDIQPIARPPRQGRQWQPYVGDTASDTSSQEEKKSPSEASGTGWNTDKPAASSIPTSPENPAARQPSPEQKSSWTVPQEEPKSSWLVPEQQNQNGWRSPSQAAPLPAPTPRRGDAHDFGVVTDLERAATPRATPSVAKENGQQEREREPSGSSGRAISIIGASKYHAETMQLRDEIDLLRKEKAELEARLAAATSVKPAQDQRSQSGDLERENADLRAKLFAMETERETIRAIMVPILGLLGLHGPKLEIRPIIPAGGQASAKKASAPGKETISNGWN